MLRFRSVSFVLAPIALAACTLDVRGLGAPEDAGARDAVATVDASSPFVDASFDDATNDASLASDTIVTPDAIATIDDGGEAGDPCDQDGDGHRSNASGCGGDDCCDMDRTAHPGQTSYFATRDACGNYDYDCNGKEDIESGVANCSLGFFACNGDGFDSFTVCGVTASYTTCAYSGFGCNHDGSMRTQRCR
jgi:hypothetical protein